MLTYPYGLSTRELQESDFYSKHLGIKVFVYKDGNWICETKYKSKLTCGYGNTPKEAVEDFKRENGLET